MKYAVTGGAGFVGRHLVKLLLDNGHNVIVIDDFSNSNLNNIADIIERIELHRINILNKNKLHSVLNGCNGVFHLAALVDVQDSIRNPEVYEQVNVIGTKNIFEIAENLGIKVVYASSSSVYGNTEIIPIKESFRTRPLNPYGQTKLECEKLSEQFHKQGLSVIGLRFFNIFGSGQSSAYAGVITKFLYSCRNSKPLEIFGTGKQIRDFVFVEDVASAIIKAMESKTDFGFFNIGSGKAYSILNIAKMFHDAFQLNNSILFSNAKEGDILQSQADISLAKSILEWEPLTTIDSWIQNKLNN